MNCISCNKETENPKFCNCHWEFDNHKLDNRNWNKVFEIAEKRKKNYIK